jgi:hypothetical protein
MKSFSGAHLYRPQCLIDEYMVEMQDEGYDDDEIREAAIDHVAELTAMLARSECPRCGAPLNPKVTAGTRMTVCRCTPVCPDCGTHEAYYSAGVWEWPLNRERVDEYLADLEARSTSAILQDDTLVTQEGVGPINAATEPRRLVGARLRRHGRHRRTGVVTVVPSWCQEISEERRTGSYANG